VCDDIIEMLSVYATTGTSATQAMFLLLERAHPWLKADWVVHRDVYNHKRWCVHVVLSSLWRLEKAGQMSRSFAD
jgi:hypothetical protein